MKTSALFLIAAAALASAQSAAPSSTNQACAKPNSSYCLGGDIILRCDANSVGTPGRCSDNLAGYPPLGGTASCVQSAPGEANCVKNCVVYAQSSSYTLNATACSATAGPTAAPSKIPHLPGTFNATANGTEPSRHSTGAPAPSVGTVSPVAPGAGNHTAPAPTAGPSSTGGAGSSKTPVAPTTTATHVPASGAASGRAIGALAVVGAIAAFFI